MTIIEANKELERIDNELELYLTKKEIILESTIYPKAPSTNERVEGGKRTDKYAHLDYSIDYIEPEIDRLYKLKKVYEEFIEKELIRLKKYDELEQLIIYYKEQTTDKLTWEQISRRVHYCKSTCRNIYRKWKKERNFDTL